MPLSWSFGADVPSASHAELDASGVLLPGARFGPYTVAGLLGEGNSARVYRARGPGGEAVALKLLRERTEPEQRARFAREGRLAASLDHPGIVRLLAGGTIEERPFLAYELVEGDLAFAELLAREGLAGRVRRVLEVAEAVAHAHARGIVHRDLKPANLLVDAGGRIRVADLGLALGAAETRHTLSGDAVGTPRYMAPEQAAGVRELGPQVDTWALGVILYEALCGQRPFPARGWLELREQLQHARPTPPRELNPDLPPRLAACCERALARDPRQRFPDAGAFAEELRRLLAVEDLPDAAKAAPGLSTPSRRPPDEETLGTRGRFELLELLGRGAMGAVYRARDPELGREVALKFLLGLKGRDRLERFRREGQVTASLRHSGILRVHSTGVLEGTPFLAYELVPGARTLGDRLRELELRRGVELLRDAARALGHAHAAGVVHRDVKPDNLLLDREDRLYVADFGLAAAEGQERLTQTGALVGTPQYMAPEQLSGEREAVGPHSDTWALGVILYELITGELPFAHCASLLELVGAVTSASYPAPRQLRPELDRRLEAVCLRALARRPADRYPQGEALAQDLDAFLSGRRPSSLSKSATLLPGQGGRPWGLLALTGALLLAILAWGLSGSPTPNPERAETPTDPPAATPARASPGPRTFPELLRIERPLARYLALRQWLAQEPPPADAAQARRALDALAREPLRILSHGPRSREVRGAFLPEGELLTCGGEGRVLRWRLGPNDPPEPQALAVPGQIYEAIAEGGGRLVAAGNTALVCLVPPGPTLPLPDRARGLAVSPDGAEVAVGLFDGRTLLVDPAGGRVLRTLRAGVETCHLTAYSPDGSLLATSSGETEDFGARALVLRLWDRADLDEPVLSLSLKSLVRALAWEPEGTLLVGTTTGQLYRLARTGEMLATFVSERPTGEAGLLRLRAHRGSMRGLVLSPEGAHVFSVGRGDTSVRNELRAWTRNAGEPAGPARRRAQPLLSLEISPDGWLLAVGTGGGTLELWAAWP